MTVPIPPSTTARAFTGMTARLGPSAAGCSRRVRPVVVATTLPSGMAAACACVAGSPGPVTATKDSSATSRTPIITTIAGLAGLLLLNILL